jgi:hypothetical protein
MLLQDVRELLLIYNRVIEIDLNYLVAYFNRGILNSSIEITSAFDFT